MLTALLRRRIAFALSSLKNKKDKTNNNPKEQSSQTSNAAQKAQDFIKLPRKNPTDFGLKPVKPVYSDPTDYLSETQKQYKQAIQAKLDEHTATRNYYKYEIERGEDLIDNIPIDPYYQYKLSELEEHLMEKESKLLEKQGLRIQENPTRLAMLQQALGKYASMKHRYEYDEFLEKLSQYPGSPKGQHPEDDPEAYQKFVKSITPNFGAAEKQLNSSFKVLTKVQTKEAENNPDTSQNKKARDNNYSEQSLKIDNDIDKDQAQQRGPSYKYLSDYLYTVKAGQKPKTFEEWNDYILNSVRDDMQQITTYAQIPSSPSTDFEQFNMYIQKMRMWQDFKKFYDQKNQKKNRKTTIKNIEDVMSARQQNININRKPGQQLNHEYFDKPTIHSLYIYYRTLPKQMRQNPIVTTIYLGLEYSSPDIKYEQKVKLLYKAAFHTLPLDKVSTAMMEQLTKKKRHYLTPHLVDRIFNMNPEYTWQLKKFLQEVKDEKLRSMSTIKQRQEHYVEPPELHKIWEEGMPSLPVDYYDNDDGFWDEHIDNKLKKYNQVKPFDPNVDKQLQF